MCIPDGNVNENSIETLAHVGFSRSSFTHLSACVFQHSIVKTANGPVHRYSLRLSILLRRLTSKLKISDNYSLHIYFPFILLNECMAPKSNGSLGYSFLKPRMKHVFALKARTA
jgi:hypothetical protein